MQTTSQRFWAIPELQLALTQHLDGRTFRCIAITSRANHQRFLANGWQQLVGIGNLFAILHDSLSVSPTGSSCPTVEIPRPDQLDRTRILRFLMHAALVQTIDVHSNPNRFVHWQGLDHLLSLPETVNQEVVIPTVTHFRINVGDKQKQVQLAPFIRLVANPRLQEIWVAPNSQLYPRSSPDDVEQVLDVLHDLGSHNLPSLQRLAIYPEDDNNHGHSLWWMLRPLSQLITNLHSLTTSISRLQPSVSLVHILSRVPLERLESLSFRKVPFRICVIYYSSRSLLTLLATCCAFGLFAFSNLRHLLLQQVSLDFACDLLRIRPLANNVVVLHLELFSRVHELALELYLDVLQCLAEFTMLAELTFAATRPYHLQSPYRILTASLQPLIQQRLEVLRLSHVLISDSEGFQQFYYPDPIISYWANLRVLAITCQDLIANDLQYFAQLPNLVELGGNVALPLATPPNKPATNVFSKELTLSSQYRFGRDFDLHADTRYSVAIVSALDTMTPNGMIMNIDRRFVRGHPADERDAVWLREILAGLKQSGKKTPAALEWARVETRTPSRENVDCLNLPCDIMQAALDIDDLTVVIGDGDRDDEEILEAFEYPDDGRLPARTQRCWLITRLGQRFTVHYRWNGTRRLGNKRGAGIFCVIYIDGYMVERAFLPLEKSGTGGTIDREWVVPGKFFLTPSQERKHFPFRFGERDITPDAEDKLETACIRVVLFWARPNEDMLDPYPPRSEALARALAHELSTPARSPALGTCVDLRDPEDTDVVENNMKVERVDDLDYTFIFFLCSASSNVDTDLVPKGEPAL
ncbi:hypothetical protein RSAG8_12362, partial [Rhizoctonia solani AG-8 WAC10335]